MAGRGRAKEHFVTLTLVADDGSPMLVTRSREAECNYTEGQLEDALCSDPRPEQALELLCRTSIIRDEWISALSVDLTETERFNLVRSALGTVDGSDLADRAKAVVSFTESMVQRCGEPYRLSRRRLEDAMSEVSTVEATAGRAGDVGAAREVVAAILQQVPSDTLERLRMARASILERRARVESLAAAVELALSLRNEGRKWAPMTFSMRMRRPNESSPSQMTVETQPKEARACPAANGGGGGRTGDCGVFA